MVKLDLVWFGRMVVLLVICLVGVGMSLFFIAVGLISKLVSLFLRLVLLCLHYPWHTITTLLLIAAYREFL